MNDPKQRDYARRDEKGRFVPGTKAGPGRPKKTRKPQAPSTSGTQLELLAMELTQREQALQRIKDRYPAHIYEIIVELVTRTDHFDMGDDYYDRDQ